jgi:hypothetical protein
MKKAVVWRIASIVFSHDELHDKSLYTKSNLVVGITKLLKLQINYKMLVIAFENMLTISITKLKFIECRVAL